MQNLEKDRNILMGKERKAGTKKRPAVSRAPKGRAARLIKREKRSLRRGKGVTAADVAIKKGEKACCCWSVGETAGGQERG